MWNETFRGKALQVDPLAHADGVKTKILTKKQTMPPAPPSAGAMSKKPIKRQRRFFEKNAQKTFALLVRADFSARNPDSQSFLLLFFKKEALAS
jgi:hypothetical protein